MILNNNSNLEIYIFNVERGISILCKTPLNHVVIYDLGSTSDFSPIKDIYKQNNFFSKMQKYEGKMIAQTIISHPHLDHISDLTNDNAIFINVFVGKDYQEGFLNKVIERFIRKFVERLNEIV